MSKEEILNKITENYLNSDFNGISVYDLNQNNPTNLKETLIELIKEEKVDVVTDENHPNPFIKAFPTKEKDYQIEKLKEVDLENIEEEKFTASGIKNGISIVFQTTNMCLYPSKKHLEKVVDKSLYSNKPYTLQLALGQPELDFASFEMRILEEYRNDPRYYYSNTNIDGVIYSDDSHESLKEKDKIFLKSFGFSFDKKNLHRHVAVFLRYLSDLSPDHQLIWKSKEINNSYYDGGNCFLHPVYASNSCGNFTDEVIIFDAITEEILHINAMSEMINGKTLFRNDFFDEINRPKEFSYLTRPTKKEYFTFVHCLDKILSDNLNKNYFKEEKLNLKDGHGNNKGTIQLLNDYFSRVKFKEDCKDDFDKIFIYLREIRKLRQKPGHDVFEDEFNYKYLDEQKTLLNNAYHIVRSIRLVLANHKNVKTYKIPEHLYKGENIINF